MPAPLPSASSSSPRRRYSWRLFRHVLREFLLVFACCVAGFLLMFLIGAIFDDLQDFLLHKAPVAATAQYFFLRQADTLVQVLPMSMLLSTMYCIATMDRGNELTAIRGAGISIFQATLPILLVGVLLAPCQFAVAEFLAPPARVAAAAIYQRFAESPGRSSAKRQGYLAYRNPAEKRYWLFRDFNPAGLSTEVWVTQFRDDDTMDWELLAHTAQRLGDGRWEFRQVTRYLFDTSGEILREPVQHQDSLSLDLPEDPAHMGFLFRLKPSKELSVFSLWQLVTDGRTALSGSTLAALRTHLIYRFWTPFTCLLAVLLGIPMAIARNRGGNVRGCLTAIGLVALYYLCSQFFVVLGENRTLAPWLAGSLPSCAFLGGSLLLFYRRT